MTSQCLLILPILHKILFLAGIFAVRVIFDQAAACTHTKQLCVLHPHRSVMHPLLQEQEMMSLQAVGMEPLVIRSWKSLPTSASVVKPIPSFHQDSGGQDTGMPPVSNATPMHPLLVVNLRASRS